MIFDANEPMGAHALERLRDDRVGWLTTVRPDGQPVSMPIWFLWRNDELIVYSDAAAKRNAHIRANPRVSFNLESTVGGGDIVVVLGQARIDSSYPQVPDNGGYLAKYGDWIDAHLGGPAGMAAIYNVVIRITPTKGIVFGG